MKKEFDKHDWACLHDAVFDAIGKDYSKEELEKIYEQLPDKLKELSLQWGMNDTEFRDGVIKWYLCPKCNSERVIKDNMFFWRGKVGHGKFLTGLVCEKCNTLHDDPVDSFIEYVKNNNH